nr:MAG TPA: hypothetical protein [Caudoviricetes sp.]
MEYCPCQTSGHFCMECEEELIAKMKRNDREKILKDKEQKQRVMLEGLYHLFKVEKTIEQMIKLGYLNRELFNKCYEEVTE